jgi:hypothetical protein
MQTSEKARRAALAPPAAPQGLDRLTLGVAVAVIVLVGIGVAIAAIGARTQPPRDLTTPEGIALT